MKDIKYFEKKMRERRKKTSFRDYLKEICSFSTFVFQKNNGMVSKFPDTDRVKKVISSDDYAKSRDSLTDKGINYDFGVDFFKNYQKLFLSIDIFNLVDYGGNENCKYVDMVVNSKNAYLGVGVIYNCENVVYSNSVKDNCKDVINSLAIWQNSEIVFNSTLVAESFKVFYSKYINNSNNIWFSSNLSGCSECIFCYNLDNVCYAIKNIVYEKEEYLRKKAELLANKNDFLTYYSRIKQSGNNINSVNTVGSAVVNSENVENGYYSSNLKNARNNILVSGIGGIKSSFDVAWAGSPTASDMYGVLGANGDNLYSSMNILAGTNIYYSYCLESCSHCIGCIGLMNKSYCILNKQYTKEDWGELASKIFSIMEDDKILGDFFPGYINPFYFNDTLAHLLGDFKKEEVEADGYMWRESELKVDIPDGSAIVKVNDLKDYQGFDKNGKWVINTDILNKVIKDEKGNYYRIVKMEYEFLIKYGLPLPELHWLDRVKLNFGI